MNKGRYWLFAAAIVVIVAVATWFLRGRPDEPGRSSGATYAQVPSQSVTLPIVASSSSGGASRCSAREGEPAARPSSSTGGDAVTTEAEVASNPLDVAPGFEPTLAPTKEPSDISPMFPMVRRHRKLSAEARDDAWAGGAESDIRSLVEKELTAQGLDTHRLELSALECRTSGCEIQAIGHFEDVGNNHAGDLQMIVPKLFQTPRGAEFDRDGTMVTMNALSDGRVGYIVFLQRKPL